MICVLQSTVQGIIVVCLLQTEVLCRALPWYAYYKPKYCTGHYRGMPITNRGYYGQVFNSSALKQFNNLSRRYVHTTFPTYISNTSQPPLNAVPKKIKYWANVESNVDRDSSRYADL